LQPLVALPEFLKPGDKIALVAPARKTTLQDLEPFISMVKQAGLEVVYTPNLFAVQNQYGGSDELRAADFQYWLDQAEIKAVLSVRGGYGTARIIDKLDFTKFAQRPKWLIGFSDFTVIHSHVNCVLKIPTLHAAMPAFLKQDSMPDVVQSFIAMFEVLKGNLPTYALPQHGLNNPGNCKGLLVGGNLSVIYSIMGSVSELETEDCILFLEDLDEYLYHLDRMMVCLKRAGKLKNLRGIIIGHMNDMHDSAIPFGKNAEEIIFEHTRELNIPLYFGFDAGHLKLNLPLIFGVPAEIENNCLTFETSNT
jgi:muramoyltetrapeptide carboxypeptidase